VSAAVEYSFMNLRLPRWMHDELRELAAAEDRSTNAEVVHAIRDHLKRQRRRQS
jgi:hypothetical protein